MDEGPTRGNEEIYCNWWWRGIALWYNERDYRQAMAVWERAVELWEPLDRTIVMDQGDGVVDDLVRETSRLRKRRGEGPTESSSVASLLLFLAGCHLDAANFKTARRLLVRCFGLLQANVIDVSSVTNHHGRNLFDAVVRECLACVEEDPECPLHWMASRKIVQYVTNNSQCSSGPFSHSFQRPGFLYSMLKPHAVPVISSSSLHYPFWCHALEDHWKIIREDLKHLLSPPQHTCAHDNNYRVPQDWPAVGTGTHRDGAGEHDGSVVNAAGDWREIVLFGAGASNSPIAAATKGVIQQHCVPAVDLAQLGGGEVIFSLLGPRTRIAPHCGTTNLRWTAHLGLIVPKTKETSSEDSVENDCCIRVADQWLHWEEGKVLVFDDSFEHEVVNNTSSIRAVLLLRFWHPALPVEERRSALEDALKAKQNERLQRCNPPLPDFHEKRRPSHQEATDRGMERSTCTICRRTGYESIRLEECSRTFYCCCGERMP